MKNKKGISIGRILLYILFLTLIVIFIYTLVITFKEIRKKEDTSTIHNVIRKVDEPEPIRNMYNNAAYPFQNKDYKGVDSSNRCFTGFYVFLKPGTYSISTNLNLSSYKYGAMVISSSEWYQSGYSSVIYDSPWFTSSSATFTISNYGYVSIVVAAADGISNISASTINSFNFMLNEGQPQNYVEYSTQFVNASSYLDYSYSRGYLVVPSSSTPPVHNTFGFTANLPIVGDPTYPSYGPITSFEPTIYNSNDLNIGSNVVNLYSSINNQSYNYTYMGTRVTESYSSTLRDGSIYFYCSTPLPINLFTFDIYGSNIGATGTIDVYGNDSILISYNFNTSSHFDYTNLTSINPNLVSIQYFSIKVYGTGSILTSSSLSSYNSYCDFHIIFDNYYGDSQWQDGYNHGFADGVSNADESLKDLNESLFNQRNELLNEIDDLKSRVNSQSIVIEDLNNRLENSENNFKGLFFTFADIPFRTVSNALGFEFWGINLFRFFVGIITALGILWLIKRLYK